MLRNRPETAALWQCIVKYAPGAWNCNSANRLYHQAVAKGQNCSFLT